MGTKSKKIKEVLRSIANNNGKSDNSNLFFTAEVTKVGNETCDIDIAGTIFTGVHLAAASDGNKNNLIVKPKSGSIVLVCDKSGGDMSWLNVVAFSEIESIAMVVDEIVINDGNNNGLVKVKELTNKINNIEDKINNLLSTLQGVSVALAPTGTFPFAPIFSGVTPLVKTQQDDIENEKIKH